jgi:hypothetical protein
MKDEDNGAAMMELVESQEKMYEIRKKKFEAKRCREEYRFRKLYKMS